MVKIIKPSPGALERLFKGATKGTVCTPFYSARGLSYLKGFLRTAEELTFLTRLNLIDWKNRVADPRALCKELSKLKEKGAKTELLVNDDVHAKIYLANKERGFAGSANLTETAFTSGLEILIEFEKPEIRSLLRYTNNIKKRFASMPLETLQNIIDIAGDTVSNYRDREIDFETEEAADFNIAVDLVEEHIQKVLIKAAKTEDLGITVIEKKLREIPNLAEYIEFCAQIKTPDAKEIVRRHKGKHNLQGHVKQTYHGVALFLMENKDLINNILKENEDFVITETPWLNRWKGFLKTNKDFVDPEKRIAFRTLRTITPETAGGTCVGGGGGIGTLNRTFILLASFFKDKGFSE